MRHAFLLSGREMVRIEDLDYQTQNVIFVVKYYQDLFDVKRMPRAIQMIQYLNNQELYRQQRASLSEDALHQMRAQSHLAVNIPSVSGGGTDEQKSNKEMMKTRIYQSYYSSNKGRVLGRGQVPFSQYVELMTESKPPISKPDQGTQKAGKVSEDLKTEKQSAEGKVLKRDKKQKNLIPLLGQLSEDNTISHSLFQPEQNVDLSSQIKETGAGPSTAQALIKSIVEELRIILEAKENDVRKEIALAWVVDISGGLIQRKSPSPISDYSSNSNIIWNQVGGSFSPQKPSKEYKAVNLERLDALLRGLSSPNMLEVSTSNPGLSDKLRAQINSINGKRFEATYSHPSKNLLKSIKFDMQNFCKFTQRESQELYQLFKQLSSEVGSFSDGSETELDLERFLDFLHHFSKQSKSHFKRILKFSKVNLNGKLAWEEFALGVREAVCIRLLESIELLIATIDKFKTSELFWDDIWQLSERFILFITREYSLLQGSLLRQITDYLTKQFFEYMRVEYKEGISLIDLKQELLEGEVQQQLFFFALLSVRESDLTD